MSTAHTALVEALKLAEWGEYQNSDWGCQTFCPVCHNERKHGHTDGCQLAAALAQAGAEPEVAPVAAYHLLPWVHQNAPGNVAFGLPGSAAPAEWRFEIASDGDVRAYAPDGETWLVRSDHGGGFNGFAHRLLTTLAAHQQGNTPSAVGGSVPNF